MDCEQTEDRQQDLNLYSANLLLRSHPHLTQKQKGSLV
jgi:hypothetical protein